MNEQINKYIINKNFSFNNWAKKLSIPLMKYILEDFVG